MFHEIIRPGVTLAPVMPGDAAELFRLVDRERARLTPRFPWVDGTRTIADTRAFIAESMAQFGRGEGTAAALREDGRIVGIIGMMPRESHPRTFEIGYWVAAETEGRGIVTDASRWLVDRCFAMFAAERVIVRAAPDNARSRAVPIRLGFCEEATMVRAGMLQPPEDLVIHVLHRDAWAAAASATSG